MRLSVETHSLREAFGDEKAIKMIKDAGFDAFDYSFYWLKGKEEDMLSGDYVGKAEKTREYIEKIGFCCNQAHAPFDFRHFDDIDMANENYMRMVRSIECAHILGADNIIMHPVGRLPSDYNYVEYNRNYLKSFLPYCEKFNMNVSVENMCAHDEDDNIIGIKGYTTPEEHIAFVKSLDSERFNICVDTGHYAIMGTKPEGAIGKMNAGILKSLHIHDNNYKADQHLLPFSGEFDWEGITSALNDIGYCGDFTLEITGFFRKIGKELFEDGLKFAERTGRALIEKVVNAKKG